MLPSQQFDASLSLAGFPYVNSAQQTSTQCRQPTLSNQRHLEKRPCLLHWWICPAVRTCAHMSSAMLDVVLPAGTAGLGAQAKGDSPTEDQ